ncbi:hypothetical protein HOLleu_11684 [Holothuria leucospilota]|uniref:Secreted protein n=1 Tax=Holothuria leucospilota TaxID=206669 RepID=A0A9Q1CGI6_HOLLE|nr:hypothetical protein HOLleu_11684 [Holothuria leucospilota]
MAHKFRILISVVILWSQGVNSLERKHLTDLREFRVQGLASKVEVPKSVVEDLFKNITTDSDRLGFPLSELGSNNIFCDLYGTLFLGCGVLHDHTLSGVSCEMKERVAASYNIFHIPLSFVSGGQSGIIFLVLFTDSDKDIFPYSTNWNHVHHIDEIEEAEDGTITLRQGNDVMAIKTQVHVQ